MSAIAASVVATSTVYAQLDPAQGGDESAPELASDLVRSGGVEANGKHGHVTESVKLGTAAQPVEQALRLGRGVWMPFRVMDQRFT